MRDRPIVFAGCEDRRSGRVQDLSVLPDPDVEGEGPAHRSGEEEVATGLYGFAVTRPNSACGFVGTFVFTTWITPAA